MKYRIYAREVHIQAYSVEAENPSQALEKWDEGEGEIDGLMEYSHIDGYTHIEDDQGNVIASEDELPGEDAAP